MLCVIHGIYMYIILTHPNAHLSQETVVKLLECCEKNKITQYTNKNCTTF